MLKIKNIINYKIILGNITYCRSPGLYGMIGGQVIDINQKIKSLI